MYPSLAISVYNGEKYLPQMVDSILDQSFRDYELILVDDGSTDSSGVLCDDYAEKDERIRVIHKENGGLCSCRNLAIEIARGSHICMLDQDDKLLPGMLERFADAIEKRPADFYLDGYNIRVEDAQGQVIERRPISAPDEWLGSPAEVRRFYLEHLGDGVVAPVWNVFYSMEYLRSSGLRFDESLRMSLDDLQFNARSYFTAQRVQVLSGLGSDYYVRTVESSSHKYNEHYLEQCAQVLGQLKEQLLTTGMNDAADMGRFYRYVAQLYVISGMQMVVYARRTLGRDQVKQKVRTLMEEPLTVETVEHISDAAILSRYDRLILTCVRKKWVRLLIWVMICKDKVRQNRFLPIAKRLMG